MMELSPFQTSILNVPDRVNIALLGARGGGKSIGAVALAMRDVSRYGEDCRILIVRKTYKALSDFEEELLAWARLFYGQAVQYDRKEKIMRILGAVISLAAIDADRDYDKFQGKSFHMIIVEEVTLYRSERTLRKLRSNLRARSGVPTRIVYLGNPGGPLHARIFQRHVKDRVSHQPYEIDDELWVTILSGPADNPFIDKQDYIKRLREACHGDEIKLRQWLYGEWELGEGLMWPMWSEDTHLIDIDEQNLSGLPADMRVGIDWGLSSPSVAHLGLRLRRSCNINGIYMPRDTMLIFDEVTDLIGKPGIDENLNQSAEWLPPKLGERVSMQAANYGFQRPSVTVDNARGLQGDTVQRMLQETGHFWQVTLPKKGRRSERWVLLGSLMQAAVDADRIRPHLYVGHRCEFLAYALANAVRDEKVPDDVADTPHCPDHPLDSASYLINEFRMARVGFRSGVVGMY